MTIKNNQVVDYFNLHISGIGYVNRIREVAVKRGESFWACDISALHGDKEDVQYTRFDCRVSGNEAEKLIRRLQEKFEADNKILIAFKLGDLYTDVFTYDKGAKKGQTSVSLKARLLKIAWIKVDGVEIYKAAPESTETDPDDNPSLEAAA